MIYDDVKHMDCAHFDKRCFYNAGNAAAIGSDNGKETSLRKILCYIYQGMADFEALIIPGGPIDNSQNAICPLIKRMIKKKKLVPQSALHRNFWAGQAC